MIIIWKCPECGDVRASNNLQHHQMDTCKCGITGIDLEQHTCRHIGYPKTIKTIKTGILRDMLLCIKYQKLQGITWNELFEEERESYERLYR